MIDNVIDQYSIITPIHIRIIIYLLLKNVQILFNKSLIYHNKLCESELDNIVSKRDELQDLNDNQLGLEVHDIYKEDEKKNNKL